MEYVLVETIGLSSWMVRTGDVEYHFDPASRRTTKKQGKLCLVRFWEDRHPKVERSPEALSRLIEEEERAFEWATEEHPLVREGMRASQLDCVALVLLDLSGDSIYLEIRRPYQKGRGFEYRLHQTRWAKQDAVFQSNKIEYYYEARVLGEIVPTTMLFTDLRA